MRHIGFLLISLSLALSLPACGGNNSHYIGLQTPVGNLMEVNCAEEPLSATAVVNLLITFTDPSDSVVLGFDVPSENWEMAVDLSVATSSIDVLAVESLSGNRERVQIRESHSEDNSVKIPIRVNYSGPPPGDQGLWQSFTIHSLYEVRIKNQEPQVGELLDVNFPLFIRSCDEPPPGNPDPADAGETRLLYVWGPGGVAGTLYGTTLDGTDHSLQTPWGDEQYEVQVSPDGKWLAFTGANPDGTFSSTDIYVLNRTNTSAVPVRLTDAKPTMAHFSQLEWSRDSTRIACRRMMSGKDTIAVVAVPDKPDEGEGGTGSNLTGGSEDAEPTWGPNDESIAFTRNGKLQYVDVSTSAVRSGTEITREIAGLAWSPDGRRLAYWFDDGLGAADIWVLDFDLDLVEQLTDSQSRSVFYANPAWAPDSKTIVCTGYSGGQALYSTTVNAGPVTRLPVSIAQPGNFSSPSLFTEPPK